MSESGDFDPCRPDPSFPTHGTYSSTFPPAEGLLRLVTHHHPTTFTKSPFLSYLSMDHAHDHSGDGSDIPVNKRPRIDRTASAASSEEQAVPQSAIRQVRPSQYVVCAYMRANLSIEKESTPSRSSSCWGRSRGVQRRRPAPRIQRLFARCFSSGLPGVAYPG